MNLKLRKKLAEYILKFGFKREGEISLDQCSPGDILLTSQGSFLEYIGVTEEWEYLDHKVKYICDKDGNKMDGFGTRTNDGFVFLKNRIPETDHDVIKIVHVV